MNSNIFAKQNSSFHLIGILGSGMSALAQYLKFLGFEVSGSDRGLNFPENKSFVEKLQKQNIHLYPQDGSFIDKETTDYVVYTTAIEEQNPDFLVSKNIPRFHRSEILSTLFIDNKEQQLIAVAGSCGKSTVTSWLGEALYKLNMDPVVVNGACMNVFEDEKMLGNFQPGEGEYIVFETDESDKSILQFSPEYSILMNIATDHYSKEELINIFEKFLENTKKLALLSEEVYNVISPSSYQHLDLIIFSSSEKDYIPESCNIYNLLDYNIKEGKTLICSKEGYESLNLKQCLPGKFNAINALSTFLFLKYLIGNIKNYDAIKKAVETFSGVHRRFEYYGKDKNGAYVYCDFAHNPEKIKSAILTAQQIKKGNLFIIFQPHGYTPLDFMRNDLFISLEETLQPSEKFIFLPVYYVGGGAKFTPESSTVCKQFQKFTCKNLDYMYFNSRINTENFLEKNTQPEDIILILGARDNSLACWADKISN